MNDVRYAARVLARHRWASAGCIALIAIAIGATVAAFSVLDVAVLRPLPLADPQQLFAVGGGRVLHWLH